MTKHVLGTLLLLAGLLSVTRSTFGQAGVPLWTNRYTGPDDHGDSARALAVDKTGRIYVAGTARIGGQRVTQTIKYASSGLPLWTNRFGEISGGGWDIALGTGGQGVYVFGVSEPFLSQFHYFLIAYSADGAALWTNHYSVPGSDGVVFLPAGIASDVSSGNVYLTGATAISPPCDIFTIAFTPTGTPLWTNFFGSSPQGFTQDVSKAIAVGGNGNIYVAATSSGNWATIAYTSAGEALWTNWFGGGMNSYDSVSDLAMANNGDVVLTGAADNDDQVAVVRYSSAGVPMWTNMFAVPSAVGSPPRVVAADNGKVQVTWTWGDGFAMIASTSSGVPLWTNHYGDSDGITDERTGLATDVEGNVYACVTSSTEIDWVIIAYSAAGVAIWTNRFDGGGDDYANGIAVSDAGEVYVVGSSDGLNGYSDWVVVKYAGISPSPIQLQIQQLGNKAILSWPDSRFTLQAAPALPGTFTNISGATSPYTNSITGAQQFFRLASP